MVEHQFKILDRVETSGHGSAVSSIEMSLD